MYLTTKSHMETRNNMELSIAPDTLDAIENCFWILASAIIFYSLIKNTP